MIGERLTGSLSTPVLILLAISLLANGLLGWALRSSWTRTGALTASFDAQKGETRTAKLANDGLLDKIDTLIGEKQSLIDQYAADREQAEREITDRDRRIRAANAKVDEERRKRNELTKAPTCAAFLDSVVADYCPDLARSLRTRATDASDSLRGTTNP